MKHCWIDVRSAGPELKKAIVEEAVHQRVDAVCSDDPADLTALPPVVRKVLVLRDQDVPDDIEGIDIVVSDASQARRGPGPEGTEFGAYVAITDSPSLEQACALARSERWSVLDFADPTKIPLEIVLAAADSSGGSVITVVGSAAEAEIVFGVLERGSDGVLLAPQGVGEVTALATAARTVTPDLKLSELEVVSTTDVGMGDRACVDTCSQFRPDEGILVGSYAHGMVLCASETHPLPYMPTRPFRINAGALHSYTLRPDERTSYLSELHSGSTVLAVDSTGRTRSVAVGRIKMESRPLLSIDAVSSDGRNVNLVVQHDWHVRVLGPGGSVLNTTDLRPGDKILGFLPDAARHVGYAIDEFCVES